MIASVISLRC